MGDSRSTVSEFKNWFRLKTWECFVCTIFKLYKTTGHSLFNFGHCNDFEISMSTVTVRSQIFLMQKPFHLSSLWTMFKIYKKNYCLWSINDSDLFWGQDHMHIVLNRLQSKSSATRRIQCTPNDQRIMAGGSIWCSQKTILACHWLTKYWNGSLYLLMYYKDISQGQKYSDTIILFKSIYSGSLSTSSSV